MLGLGLAGERARRSTAGTSRAARVDAADSSSDEEQARSKSVGSIINSAHQQSAGAKRKAATVQQQTIDAAIEEAEDKWKMAAAKVLKALQRDGLASLVAKRRRGLDKRRLQFDIERLVEDVKAAYDEYPVEKIETMWAYKIDIMQKVIDCNGGNCYDRRRRKWCDGEGSQSQE